MHNDECPAKCLRWILLLRCVAWLRLMIGEPDPLPLPSHKIPVLVFSLPDVAMAQEAKNKRVKNL